MSETLHTKYRPATLEEVRGQGAVVKSIKEVLAKGASHSFLLTGPSGCGKTTVARIIARMVGCGKHNLVEVDAATNTGIDAMRAVSENLIFAPLASKAGGARVVILDEAHMLSKAAWNSLLKAIEEPPTHVYWALCTTEAAKVPETIRNRCTVYDLRPVSSDDIYAVLQEVCKAEGFTTSEEVLDLIATKAQGSLRRALTTLAQCSGCTDRKEAAGLMRAASEEGEVIDLCRALIKGRLTWAQVTGLVAPIADQNGEGIRLTIVAYFTKVLLGTKGDEQAARLLNVLDAFREPYPSGAGVAPVLLSLGRVVFDA